MSPEKRANRGKQALQRIRLSALFRFFIFLRHLLPLGDGVIPPLLLLSSLHLLVKSVVIKRQVKAVGDSVHVGELLKLGHAVLAFLLSAVKWVTGV
jgi:hypothetical protein